MSGRYSDDYRRGGGGGGYGNRGRGGGYGNGYGKINEDDVPASKHAIFVRGLPSSITAETIKDFFEDKIGPCSFDFQKVNFERQSLFVAVRFDSTDDAKKAYNRYTKEDILGCRCEVTWFKDIRRYIAYQTERGGTIRRGNFGRHTQQRSPNRYGNNYNKTDYRKRRYSDDRRSRSRSSSGSDRSRSRSRRSSRDSRSRSRSRSDRSSSRESDRRRPDSREEKRKEKKEKKAPKKDRRGRRSGTIDISGSSGSERSRSRSRSDREDEREGREKKKAKKEHREASPASAHGSPPRKKTPPPVLPNIVANANPPAAAAATAIDSAPLRITISNKATVPVENTSFKVALDTDEPPRKIIRGPSTPEMKKEDDDAMEIEETKEALAVRKEIQMGMGGWKSVGGNASAAASTIKNEVPAPASLPPPSVIQPTLAKRSVGGPSPSTPNPPPPSRPPTGTPSSLPPPPGRPSIGGAGGVSGVTGALAAKCPEMAKTIGVIKTIQDQLITSVRPNNRLSLSDLSSGESVLEKMEERERQIRELNPTVKNKFDMKMKQISNSYRGDAQTITTVVKSLVQKDPTLQDQIKPALLAVLEDVEKQIYKKVDDFLVCGM